MRNEYLLKQLEKNGFKPKTSLDRIDRYECLSKNGHAIAEWFVSEESATCLKVRNINDHDDGYSDYSAGSFYETVKGTVDALFRRDENAAREIEKKESIALKEITIERAEGPSHLCVKKSFPTLCEAQGFLNSQMETYPKEGYDKHDISLVFKDGLEYSYRGDLQHFANEYFRYSELNIKGYVENSLKYYEEEARKGVNVSNAIQVLRKVKNRLM